MLLVEVAGRSGTAAPAQISIVLPKSNVGSTMGFTVTVKVAVVAHWPAPGVKVYVPEAWLSTVAGDQVPAIPLSEVAGKEGTVAPSHMLRDVPKLNAGMTFCVTVTVKVVVVAHCPAVGVNV